MRSGIPYLQLSEIDFSAPKRQKVKSSVVPSATVSGVIAQSSAEKEDLFHEIVKEHDKKPLVVEPYCEKFVHASDHLPKLLHGIFRPEHLDTTYTQLLALAESYVQEKVYM